MKVVIAVACLVACAAAATHGVTKDFIPILKHDAVVDHDGKFHYSYESADGTVAEQHGDVKVVDKDQVAQVIQGKYAFKSDDGQTYSVSYVADEFGYRPEGAHLPVAPPVPAAIQRALEYIAAHPYVEEKQRKF